MVDQPIDFYIYIHRKATTGEVFYVGKGHKGRAWSRDRRNKHWINVVSKHGYTVEVIEHGYQAWYAYEREQQVISAYKASGAKLTNKTDGGDGVIGYEWTDEHRLKTSLASKQMWQRSDYRKTVVRKAAEGQKRVWADPAYKAKMVATLQAARNPEAMSNANRITWADPEVRARRTAGIRAAHSRADVKEKMSAAQKTKWLVGDAKAKLRASKEPNMKPVLCVQTGRVFDAIKAAVRWLVEVGFTSASKANIRTTCQGKTKTAYGYQWQFVDGVS